jgi:glycosyltransferase involved in cell wall biosynthesis
VHVIVPDGIDDPTRPSGGNTYDRHVCRGLADSGWVVHEHVAPGGWPEPDAAACAALTEMLAALPDGAVVLLDGLVASTVPEVLVPEAGRLRLVVLVHMPLGERSTEPSTLTRESAVLSAAAAVVTTSAWSRCWLLERYPVRASRVHVARPGVEPADPAPGSPDGGHLLCVAAVVPDKGHDLLLAALAEVKDLGWRCVCVGSLSRDPGHVERLLGLVRSHGIEGRVRFTGPRTGDDLEASYAGADALVLATRAETYGMVVAEALAHGLPVLATAVGGLPEALGRLPDGSVPGLLVPPDDPAALATALRRWLVDQDLRVALRETAGRRRTTLSGWAATSSEVARVLAEVAS